MSAPDLNAVKLITAALKADETLGKAVDVIRGHRPSIQGKTLTSKPLIVACPGGRSKESASRNSSTVTAIVYVGIMAKLSSGQGVRDEIADDLAELESLIDFSEELERWFLPDSGQGRNFAGPSGNYTVVDPLTTDPAYDPDEAERGRFLSVIQVQLEELRA
ncbi:hypothetical protein [Thalassoglobus polymorphus]|uniref:Uncharacterized protein n=1 Tax=Thalassoglobus polymorphus TaxID=2527994 RepID=A0A517QH70_9PLAN|nr:hypothetical protein [Thalassoglobus polymorphus]QDT30933.1 hypothetical protein Mal48_01620 [Thalassoglobus polymorphus]QDT30978.1 hypothetical protein Mal48_02070 [Thalassoglobus polymorphus]